MASTPSESLDSIAQVTARNRQWCERVAVTMELSPEQLDDLKQLVNLASQAAHDSSTVRLFIWQQATQYRILNTIIKSHVDFDRFLRVLNDVEDHLGTAWKVSEELKVIVKVEARNLLVDCDQPSYTTMHLDVMAYLRLHKDRLGIQDVFGNPARESLLNSNVKKACSNARTSLREILILSVSGRGKKSLEDTTWFIMNRFKKGGTGTDLKLDYQIRVALLRRWTYEEFFQSRDIDNQDRLVFNQDGAFSDSPTPASSVSTGTADDALPLPKKHKLDDEEKVLKHTVGKVPKGEDFWSKIDRRLDIAVQAWGDRITTPEWREYIDDTVKRDRRLFGRCTTGVLPSIPVQTYSIPSTSLSLPGSSLCIPTNSASTPTRSFSPVLSEDTLSVSGLSNIAAATPSEGPGGAVISGFPQVPTHTPSPSLWD